MFTINDFWKIFRKIKGDTVTDLQDTISSVALSEKARTGNFFENIIDQICFSSNDYNMLRQFLIDWYAAHKTITTVQRNASDPFSLPNSHLNELFSSFGYPYSYELDIPGNVVRPRKVNFFLDLVNIYKIKGTPRGLLKAIQYYGISELNIYEFWLQYNELGSLIFKGEAIEGTSVNPFEINVNFSDMISSDPHWRKTESQINTLFQNTNYNFPAKTPYFGVQPVIRAGVISSIISRKVRDQYDTWNTTGSITDQDITLALTKNTYSVLEVYLGATYIFDKDFSTGIDSTSFVCYDKEVTDYSDIVEEYLELTNTEPTSRLDKINKLNQLESDFNRSKPPDFLKDSKNAGYWLELINPTFKESLDAIYTSENSKYETLESLVEDFGKWLKYVLGYGYFSFVDSLFGISTANLENVINFFKPYRARLVYLELLEFDNKITESCKPFDDLILGVDHTEVDWNTANSTSCDDEGYPVYSRETYDCGSEYDIGACIDEEPEITITQNIEEINNCLRDESGGFVTVTTPQNYMTFTETDIGADRISINNASKIIITDGDTNEEYCVYKDYSAGYFSGNFEHKFKINFTGDAGIFLWALTNFANCDFATELNTNNEDALCLFIISAGGSFGIGVREYNNGSITTDIGITSLSLGTDYYITIQRDELTSAYGNLSCYVYNDYNRTNLVDIISIPLSEKQDFRYLYQVSSGKGLFGNGGDEIDLTIEDLSFVTDVGIDMTSAAVQTFTTYDSSSIIYIDTTSTDTSSGTQIEFLGNEYLNGTEEISQIYQVSSHADFDYGELYDCTIGRDAILIKNLGLGGMFKLVYYYYSDYYKNAKLGLSFPADSEIAIMWGDGTTNLYTGTTIDAATPLEHTYNSSYQRYYTIYIFGDLNDMTEIITGLYSGSYIEDVYLDNLPDSLETFQLSSLTDNVYGSMSDFPNTLVTLDMRYISTSTSENFNISDLVSMPNLETLKIKTIGDFPDNSYPSLTTLILNNMIGAPYSFIDTTSVPENVERMIIANYFYLRGDIGDLRCNGLTYLDLFHPSPTSYLTGDLKDFPITLKTLQIQRYSNLNWDFADITNFSSLEELRLSYVTDLFYTPGAVYPAWGEGVVLDASTTNLDQTSCDEILIDLAASPLIPYFGVLVLPYEYTPGSPAEAAYTYLTTTLGWYIFGPFV